METLQVIHKRRSVRTYTNQDVSDEMIQEILNAGMCAPTACNAKPYQFIVVKDKELLNKMAEGNGIHARMLKEANFAILACADLEEAKINKHDGYWIIDVTIACENMVLAATDLGIGTCWIGTYPQTNKIDAQREIFQLPNHIIPHSIISFGYSKEPLFREEEHPYLESRVHFNKW